MKVSILYELIGIQIVSASYSLSRDPNYEDFLDVKTIIEDRIDSSTCPPPPGNGDHWDWNVELGDCNLFPRDQGRIPLLARLVRLSFHDAAGKSDGFLNLQDPENNGLFPAISVLDNAYDTDILQNTNDKVNKVLSKADFYAWAGQIAVQYASALQIGNFRIQPGDYIPKIPVRWGRNTYIPTGNNDLGPQEDFPISSGHATAQGLEDYFSKKFGFNATQSATIMGAHTLGQARREFSGFRGPWTNRPITFDEEYYSNMVGPQPVDCTRGPGRRECVQLKDCCLSTCADRCLGWEQVRIRNGPRSDDLFQWQHSCSKDDTRDCTQLMLNADITFLHNMEEYICKEGDSGCEIGRVKGFSPNSSCKWGVDRILATCFSKRASSSNVVETFSNNKTPLLMHLLKFFIS